MFSTAAAGAAASAASSRVQFKVRPMGSWLARWLLAAGLTAAILRQCDRANLAETHTKTKKKDDI